MILLGISNGYTTTYIFIFSSMEVPEKFLGKAGGCINLFLNFGVIMGSFYALFVTQNYLIWFYNNK